MYNPADVANISARQHANKPLNPAEIAQVTQELNGWVMGLWAPTQVLQSRLLATIEVYRDHATTLENEVNHMLAESEGQR